MQMQESPTISIVLATHNRRDVVLSTLRRLGELRSGHVREILVVDNASTDGTADAIATEFPNVALVSLAENRGSCAKAFGADRASGEIILFLDDDSHPRDGSLKRLVEHFEANHRLGAAGFRVHLPDGRRESSALPHVFVGCGVGFRRRAYESVGGLDRDLFMQAEEYDLCFRIMADGWDAECFNDLHVEHLKTSRSRLSERTCFYDTRNNLLVTARYVPDEYESIYRDDVLQRYRWIAESQGHLAANQNAEAEAMKRYKTERDRYANCRLDREVFEALFQVEDVATRFRDLHDSGVRRVVLADLGKNIYPFVRGARACDMEVCAIADDRFAQPGRHYRGIPIVEPNAVSLDGIDAIIVSNMSAAHATRTKGRCSKRTNLPVLAWHAESTRAKPVSSVVAIEQAAESAENAAFAGALSARSWGVGDDAVGQPAKW